MATQKRKLVARKPTIKRRSPAKYPVFPAGAGSYGTMAFSGKRR